MADLAFDMYERGGDVVHRVLADRVLVRRVGDRSANVAVDLVGATGVVWIACEEPTSVAEIASQSGLTVDEVVASAEALVEGGWLTPRH